MKDNIKEAQNEDGWVTLSTDLQSIKPKDTILFDTFLDKKGVYSVDIRLSNAIATPGRTMAVNISLLSPSKQTLFNNQKTLQPTLSKSKQDSNTWSLFIPIEDATLNSCLSISYKSNALLNPIEISTIIKYVEANDRKDIIEAIENHKLKNVKPEEFLPFQVINFDLCGCSEEIPPLLPTSDNENSNEEIEFTSTTENLLKEKETPKEREVDQDNILKESVTSNITPEATPSNFVLVEKGKSVDTDTIVYETIKENAATQNDKNFHKKTIFEDYNVSLSSLNKYIKTMPVTPGIYALQIDISNKINSARRSLEITYKIYNNTGEDFEPIKQNLVEKFSQKEILMLKKGYLFLKPDICVPNENCTLWLKIKSPVLIPVKLDVKLFQTKSLTVSEHILSNPLRQINDVKNFITEMIPVKKNVWSIQKTLSFNKTEIFEIELSPGVYTFFISKLDNMDIPLRNFKLNLSLHNDRMCEDVQNVSLRTICVDEQIGDGENSQPDSNIEFECQDDCVLRIRLDAGMMSAPIPFYARVQKLTKFDLKTIRHEGLSWLYYLSLFLGFFVFIKYILLFVNFFSSFKIFGFNFEFVFLFIFVYWFFSTDQLSNMKYYQVKIDEMRLKTGFEKFKMFLKHAKNGEEERKLEILNRKFSD